MLSFLIFSGLTQWAEYETGLKQRGSMTPWITPEAIQHWAATARTMLGRRSDGFGFLADVTGTSHS